MVEEEHEEEEEEGIETWNASTEYIGRTKNDLLLFKRQKGKEKRRSSRKTKGSN